MASGTKASTAGMDCDSYILMQTFPTFLTNRKSCADHSTTVWSFSRLCFHVNVCKRIRIFHRLDCGDGLQIIVFLMYSDIKCSYTHKIFKGAEMQTHKNFSSTRLWWWLTDNSFPHVLWYKVLLHAQDFQRGRNEKTDHFIFNKRERNNSFIIGLQTKFSDSWHETMLIN